jgi:hypothetical protein
MTKGRRQEVKREKVACKGAQKWAQYYRERWEILLGKEEAARRKEECEKKEEKKKKNENVVTPQLRSLYARALARAHSLPG